MEKTKILRILLKAILGTLVGFITVFVFNKISGAICFVTQIILNLVMEKWESSIGILAMVLIGILEIQFAIIPMINKFFHKNLKKIGIIKVILQFIFSAILGFITVWCLNMIAAGIFAVTNIVFALVMAKWRAIFGIVVLLLLGIIELKIAETLFSKFRHNEASKKSESPDKPESSDKAENLEEKTDGNVDDIDDITEEVLKVFED